MDQYFVSKQRMKPGLCGDCALAFTKRQTGDKEARWKMLITILDQII